MGLREEKKSEQRRAILDTALALFRKRGYDQTRVQDIIDRLRISEATFFNYFPAKDALLQEAALDELDTSNATLKAELERHDASVPDRIRRIMRIWASGWSLDPEFQTLLVTRSRMISGPRGALRAKVLRGYAFLGALFAEGQKRGDIRTDADPVQLAEILEGIYVLTAGNWMVGWWGKNAEPLEKRLMRAVEVFLDGCRPAHAATSRKSRSNSKVRAGSRNSPARETAG